MGVLILKRMRKVEYMPVTVDPIRVLLVDDHPVVRSGLKQIIQDHEGMTVCGEASSSAECMKIIGQIVPDVAVVDLFLSDRHGLELVQDINNYYPAISILVLSMHDETVYAERSLQVGAKGYMMKDFAADQIAEGVRRVSRGEIYLSDRLASKILSRAVTGKKEIHSDIELLTTRELEVFELLGQGLGVKQIAQQLHLSPKTVDSHRENIKHKLQIHDSALLLRKAVLWTENLEPL